MLFHEHQVKVTFCFFLKLFKNTIRFKKKNSNKLAWSFTGWVIYLNTLLSLKLIMIQKNLFLSGKEQ